MTTAETGAAGERAAAEYLRKAGYRLLERNWRRGNYELDLVVTDGEVLHIVEVKTRHAGALTPPEAAATRRKFRALTRAAAAYLRETGRTGEGQFDVAAGGGGGGGARGGGRGETGRGKENGMFVLRV